MHARACAMHTSATRGSSAHLMEPPDTTTLAPLSAMARTASSIIFSSPLL